MDEAGRMEVRTYAQVRRRRITGTKDSEYDWITDRFNRPIPSHAPIKPRPAAPTKIIRARHLRGPLRG